MLWTWIRTLLSMLLCLSVHCVFFNHKIIRSNSLHFSRYKKNPSIFGSFFSGEKMYSCVYHHRIQTRQTSCSVARTIAIFASSSSASPHCTTIFLLSSQKHIKTMKTTKLTTRTKNFFFKIESIFLLCVYVCVFEWNHSFENFQSHRLRFKVFPLNSDKETTQITIYCL